VPRAAPGVWCRARRVCWDSAARSTRFSLRTPLDAVQGAVDFRDFVLMVQGFGDDSGEAGVDDGRGAAALRDEKIAL